MEQDHVVTISLPEWATTELSNTPRTLLTLQDRMRTVHRFARLNMRNRTGGPFAAAVVECASGRVVSIGVNRVEAMRNSCAHAEVVAIALAQRTLDSYDLGAEGLPSHDLVVNWRPCVMCMGAVVWSGVRRLVIAGEGDECENITGFDEGPVHPDWREELKRRGIEVLDDVLRDGAIEVFKEFAESGNNVYNARGGSSQAS